MKTIILVCGMFLFAGITFGQALKKGNFIGLHVEDVKLAPGVTMEQYIEFLTNKYVPEYEKAFDSEVHIMKGIRGENVNKYAMLIIYDSELTRNKYFEADGTVTKTAGKNASQKMQSIIKELEKLGTSNAKYTDWLVQ